MNRASASSVAPSPFVWSLILSASVAAVTLVAFPPRVAHVPPVVGPAAIAAADPVPEKEAVTYTVPPPLPDAAPVVLTFTAEVPLPRARPVAHETLLVDRARKYLGTNPTGWARLWCARFMCMVAPETCKRVAAPNLARSWAKLPRIKPRVGAIVVLTRGRDPNAGHIGVVTGFDRRGNPRVVSGNHNRRVAESVYPKSRVLAYVTGASS